MKKSDISFKITKKAVKNIKTFIYRGKSFQFDFNLLKENSLYIHKNRNLFKDREKINLLSGHIEKAVELSDNVITSFINCCEENVCKINKTNVIPLQFLAYRYEVPELIDVANKFISDNFSQLAVKSISFKNNFNNIENEEWLEKYSNCSKEESVIATNLAKYFDDDDLFILPISIIERIFYTFFFQSNSGNLIKNKNFTDFLFNCLDHYGKEASILFSYIDFESQSIEVVDRLLKDYSKVFDFNMINSTLLKTTSQLTNEMSKIKLEYSNSMSQLKKLFDDQKEELKNISKQYLKKEKEEDERAAKREEIFKQQIKKLKEENENQKKIFTEILNEMKKRQEEVINLSEIQNFHKLIRESMRFDVFNDISVESKKFFIKNVIKNSIQFDDDNESCYLARKIIILKDLHESLSKIEKKSVDLSEQIEFIYSKINKLVIDFKIIELFYQNKTLQKILTNLVNLIDNITVEIKYPSGIFNEILAIVKQVHDDMENHKIIKNTNLNKDQEERFKVDIIISDIKNIDKTICNNSFIQNLKLVHGVNKVEKQAFYNYKYLTNIELASSITSIEDGAFDGCTKLVKIKIPSSVASIGSQAFYNCSSLKQVIIESKVASIGDSTFYNCKQLQEITIPKSVTSIGNNAFYGCSSLRKVIIPPSVTSIGSSVFQNCSQLQEITIPKSVTSIGSKAFYGCSSLRKVIIPPSVTSIGSNAFYNCRNIREVECDPYKISLTSVFQYYNSITNLTINTTTSSIYNNNLYNLSNLKQIIISSPVTTIGDNSFYNISQLQDIVIPESVTTIQNSVFQNCSQLQEITIPKSVTSIGSNAFYGCSSLRKVIIPPSVTSIGSNAFYNCSNIREVECDPYKISLTSVFQYYNSITNLTINTTSSTLTNINISNLSNLNQITILSPVTTIGDNAFSYCLNLKQITIPESVTTIGNNSFINCSSLYEINMPKQIQRIGSKAFYGCSSLTNVDIPSTAIVAKDAFEVKSNEKKQKVNKKDSKNGWNDPFEEKFVDLFGQA